MRSFLRSFWIFSTAGTSLLASLAGCSSGGASPTADCGLPSGTFSELVTGSVSTLVPGQDTPSSIVVDSTSVYWINIGVANPNDGGSSGAVMKAALDGSSITTVASDIAYGGGVLAVDSTSLYWTDGPSVVQQSLDGGSAQTLASGFDAPNLAVDATGLYWCDPGQSALLREPLDGGALTTLASGVFCGSVAVGSSAVYTLGNGRLVAAPLDGGTTQILEFNSGDGIAVDSTSVYWIGSPDGRVLKAGLDGGTVTTLASAGLCFAPAAVAIDTTNVYWADQEQGTISKAALDGGGVTTLASGLGFIRGLAIDSTSVYYTEQNSGAVMRITPK